MALTRRLLEGMGIDEKQIETIIEAHAETVNGLKADRDKYREDAEKVPTLEEKIKGLQDASNSNGEWEKKYNAEHEAFEQYKTTIASEKQAQAKEKAYRAMLIDAGIDPRRVDKIMKLSDVANVELDESGKLKDIETLTEEAKKEWPEFIIKTRTEGAEPATPPENTPGVQGADPEIAKRMQARHERLYGKVENKED